MTRIKLNDSILEMGIKLSEGNPGAISVIGRILREGEAIDPDSFFGGIGAVLALDTHQIYGPSIWMLYKDVCGEDLRVTLALLRAVQLGFLRESALRDAIDNYREGIDVPALVAKVEEDLPNFQRAPVAQIAEE